MPGFDDLVARGTHAVVGDGCRSKATEGVTWYAALEALDGEGAPIDFTGVVGECTVWDRTTVVTTIPVVLSPGLIELTKPASATGGLAGGVRGGRRCVWGLQLYNLSQRVQIWSPDNSFLTITNDTGV